METCSICVLWIGLLCINLVSSANGEDYLIDKESDGLILDLAAIFFVLCILFLVLMVVLAVVVYKKANTGFASERSLEYGTTTSGPFDGGTYLSSSEIRMYLPGRPSSNANGTDLSQIRRTYETLKGTKRVSQTYQNRAYDSGCWSLDSGSVTRETRDFEIPGLSSEEFPEILKEEEEEEGEEKGPCRHV